MEHFFEIFKEEKLSDFNPIGCGFGKFSTKNTPDLDADEYILMHYIVEGVGKIHINAKSCDIKAGQVFILPKNTKSKYSVDKKGSCTSIWLAFNGNLSKGFLNSPTIVTFKSSLFFDILNLHNMNSLKQEYLAQLIFRIYIELFQEHTHIDHVKAIKDYIDSNYMQNEVTVDAIAKSLNLNRSYISRIFSQKQGISIKNYLIYVRIEKAKELLAKGHSVQDVSKLVGYSDQFQFSKAFKLATSEPPSSYKANRILED